MTRQAEPILIAACGNVMAGDDAFGPLVANALRGMNLLGVEIVDLDINPAELLNHLADREALIVVDAVRCPGATAGHVIDADWFDPDRPPLAHDDVLSSHGLSLADQIELAHRLGLAPKRVRLIGVAIGHADLGRSMTDVVRERAPRAARAAAHWAELWLKASGEVAHA